ncbi:hypothetical protein CJU90_0667 [Yarrowia sp. C11]|nr:hypothetical protein CKK34_2079 [Yarrowia sp. E02]KAG5373003.1 hypothetical protein CJU90_0667 [Yarrowia sp. C11]
MSKKEEYSLRVRKLARQGQRLTYPDTTVTSPDFDYPSIHKELFNGKVFRGLETAKSHADKIAAKYGFAITTRNSNGYMSCKKFNEKPTAETDKRCTGLYNPKARKTRITHTGCDFSMAIRNNFNTDEWYLDTTTESASEHNHLPSVSPASNPAYRAQMLDDLRRMFKPRGDDSSSLSSLEDSKNGNNDGLDICKIFMDVQAPPQQLLDALRNISPKGYMVTNQDIRNMYKRRDQEIFGDLDPTEALLIMLEKTPHFHYSYRVEGGPSFLEEVGDQENSEDEDSDEVSESDDDTVPRIPSKRVASVSESVPRKRIPTRLPPLPATGSQNKTDPTIKDIFFLHRKSIKFMRTYPEVISIHCTHNTNGYNYKLVNITGISPDNKSFPIAHAFVSQEDTDTFAWCLNELKKIMEEFNVPFPQWILSDCSEALLKAKSLGGFPGKIRLGEWHANQTVLRRASTLFKTDSSFDKFVQDWNRMKAATEKREFRRLYSRFRNEYWKRGSIRADQMNSAYFCIKHFFGDPDSDRLDKIKYRHVLVSAYAEETDDLFDVNTSRTDSLHAALEKSTMEARISSLYVSAMIVIRCSLGLLADLEMEHSDAMEKYQVGLIRDYNEPVKAFISELALEKTALEYQEAMYETETDCSGSIWKRQDREGEAFRPNENLNDYVERPRRKDTEKPTLKLGDFHPHWRNLHATQMMESADWSSATRYGQHRQLWKDVRNRFLQNKEIDEKWRKKDEEMLQELESNQAVRRKTKGAIPDVFARRTTRNKSTPKKACPHCKSQESGHQIAETCFSSSVKYLKYLDQHHAEARLRRIALEKKEMKKGEKEVHVDLTGDLNDGLTDGNDNDSDDEDDLNVDPEEDSDSDKNNSVIDLDNSDNSDNEYYST